MCWLFVFFFHALTPGLVSTSHYFAHDIKFDKKSCSIKCVLIFSYHSLSLCHGLLKLTKIRDIRCKVKVFFGITNLVLLDILKCKIQI